MCIDREIIVVAALFTLDNERRLVAMVRCERLNGKQR